MFKIIKKADIFLVAALVVIGIVLSIVLSAGQTDGDTAKITIDGKVYGTYSLLENQSIAIDERGEKNTVVIDHGSVCISKANCKGKDCVRQGKISQTGQTIVCLPHKMIIEIQGGESKYDSISK